MDVYLQQLAKLELLFSDVQAGGGAESQQLERRMQLAEEMLRTILGEALSLQGTIRSLLWMGPSVLYFYCTFLLSDWFLFSLSLSFFLASDRSLESRMARMKGQGSNSQSCLGEIKATVERLRSLGSQYERQVQETQQLLERARLDMDRSGATLRQVVRAFSCDALLVWPGLKKNPQKEQEFNVFQLLHLFCECRRYSGDPFCRAGIWRGAGRGLWGAGEI